MTEKITAREVLEKGIALLNDGKTEEAISCFKTMVAEEYSPPLAMSCLGLAMARAGKDLASAEQYSIKAIEKRQSMYGLSKIEEIKQRLFQFTSNHKIVFTQSLI